MMENPFCKKRLRQKCTQILSNLSPSRRLEAEEQLLDAIVPLTSSYSVILSFASFRHEIHTHTLNSQLAKKKQLALPRMEGDTIQLYLVEHPEKQLILNHLGILEPNPNLCNKIAHESVDLALIPALGFDQNHHRLGYGKGIYDKLLPKLTKSINIGIGFCEQKLAFLPTEAHDYALTKLILF